MSATPHNLADRFTALRGVMSAKQLAQLSDHLRPQAVDAGAVVITEGERSDSLYLVDQGEVQIQLTDGKRVVGIGKLGPGQWFGEVGLLDPGPASADVRAIQASDLLVLDHKGYRALEADHPDVASHLLQVLSLDMAERLRASATRLLSSVGEGQYQIETVTPDRPGWLGKLAAVLAGDREEVR